MPQTSWADVLKKTGPVSSHSVGVAGTALIHKVPTLYERVYPGVADLLDSPVGLAFARYITREIPHAYLAPTISRRTKNGRASTRN